MKPRVLLALILAAIAAVALPGVAVANMAASANRANAHAEELRAPLFVENPENPAPVASVPLLRAERAPEMLWRNAQNHYIATELTAFSADWPQPNCLAIRVEGIDVYTSDARPVVPASVHKLLTAAAALELLDHQERYVTRVATDADIIDGVLQGNIWVIGGGDPLIMTQGYANAHRRQPQLRTPIEELVDDLEDLGIRTIIGRFVADESRYVSTRYPETWPRRYITDVESGPLSALSLNDGITGFTAALSATNHPARWFVGTLADLLRVRGMSVIAEVGSSVAPHGLLEIARLESPPMVEIIGQMLRESDNTTAELVLREIGLNTSGEGSTPAGAAAAEEKVAAMFPDHERPAIIDGSGLDRQNRVTCSFLVELLDHYGLDSPLGASLPIAAETGTLSHRFDIHPAAGRLHAKTGLLDGVNSLAGFLETDTGVVTFAQILNGVPPDSGIGIELQDSLARHLLRYPVGDLSALEDLLKAQ